MMYLMIHFGRCYVHFNVCWFLAWTAWYAGLAVDHRPARHGSEFHDLGYTVIISFLKSRSEQRVDMQDCTVA